MTESSSTTPAVSTSHPIEGGDRPAVPRPSWAEASTLSRDHTKHGDVVVEHTWTSPSWSSIRDDGKTVPVYVKVTQLDALEQAGAHVVAVPEGPAVIYLSGIDVQIDSTDEARRLAAALLACCDRLDGTRQ